MAVLPVQDEGSSQVFSQIVGYLFRVVLWLFTFPILAVVMPFLFFMHKVYASMSARALIQGAKALGFGLPLTVLSRWDVVSDPHIAVPHFFDEEFVDVSKERYQPLVGSKASDAGLRDHRGQFGYLWDDELLRQGASKSILMSALDSGDRIQARLITAPRSKMETKLVLTIEDRLRELTGSMELTHCTYYQQEEDIERIASFLERDVTEPSQCCLEELRELPSFGPRFVPTRPIVILTMLLVGLKLWGRTWVASLPWVVALAPYLVTKAATQFTSLRVDQKKASYIRRAVSSIRHPDRAG
jgi:hypothetical protein